MPFKPSFWEQQSLLSTYDCVIVGAGLTGLHTSLAVRKKYPNFKIAILERGPFSIGASTRNAGFACFGNCSEILDDLKSMSEDQTYGLMEKRYKGLLKTRALLGDTTIDYQQKGSNELFNTGNRADYELAKDYLPMANQLMREHLGLKDVFSLSTEKFGFNNGIGAISNAFEGQLNTGKLYASLRKLVLQNDIEIFGGCDISHWGSFGEKVKIVLKNGMEIDTYLMVLATNAFTSQLMPNLDIVPARGQIIVTEKIPNLNLEGIFHYDQGYYYWRDLEGRILLGGARNKDVVGETQYEFDDNNKIQDELENFLYQHILNGQIEVPIAMKWSGIMAMGKQKDPIVKQVSSQVFLVARLGGMGVALSSVVAEDVVGLI